MARALVTHPRSKLLDRLTERVAILLSLANEIDAFADVLRSGMFDHNHQRGDEAETVKIEERAARALTTGP
jgi:hypothetical protein